MDLDCFMQTLFACSERRTSGKRGMPASFLALGEAGPNGPILKERGPLLFAGIESSVADEIGCGLGPPGEVELGEDVAEIILHGLVA